MCDAELQKGLKDLGYVQSPKCDSLSDREGPCSAGGKARALPCLSVYKAEQSSLLVIEREASWVKCV